jgi:hypothetical protein
MAYAIHFPSGEIVMLCGLMERQPAASFQDMGFGTVLSCAVAEDTNRIIRENSMWRNAFITVFLHEKIHGWNDIVNIIQNALMVVQKTFPEHIREIII